MFQNLQQNRSRQASFAGSNASSKTFDAGLRDYMIKVYNFMGLALVFSGLIAIAVSSSPTMMKVLFGTQLRYLIMFAPIAFILFFSFKINSMSAAATKNCLWLFSGLMGLSLSSIFIIYTNASIARIFFITASVFGAMSLYGYTTKKDLTNLGSFLMMGLFAVIIASLVNIFMKSGALQFILSILSTLIFVGLTAYDVQKIKQNYYYCSGNDELIAKASALGALNLYMDFINIFIHLLQIFGNRRD
jgi:FtsH-binding integral membrane protein